LSSPFIYEQETIKYIDVDLDYKIPNIDLKNIKLVDQNEYVENMIRFKYPEALKEKISSACKDIESLFANGELVKLLDRKEIEKQIEEYTKNETKK
jgi:protein associated with RNAse G/E